MKDICIIDKPYIYSEGCTTGFVTDLYFRKLTTKSKWERVEYIENIRLESSSKLTFTYIMKELNDNLFEEKEVLDFRICIGDDRFPKTKKNLKIYCEVKEFYAEIVKVVKFIDSDNLWKIKVYSIIKSEKDIDNDTL